MAFSVNWKKWWLHTTKTRLLTNYLPLNTKVKQFIFCVRIFVLFFFRESTRVYQCIWLGLAPGKRLQKQQGSKCLKNWMSAWYIQLSVSAELPTAGNSLSDKYKHSFPRTAFLSQRRRQEQQGSFHSWHQMLKANSEKPRWDDSEQEGPLWWPSMQQHFPSEWKYLKAITPSILHSWQTDWHLTCQQWHTDMFNIIQRQRALGARKT